MNNYWSFEGVQGYIIVMNEETEPAESSEFVDVRSSSCEGVERRLCLGTCCLRWRIVENFSVFTWGGENASIMSL